MSHVRVLAERLLDLHSEVKELEFELRCGVSNRVKGVLQGRISHLEDEQRRLIDECVESLDGS